jgi:HEPN domain-containing protein
VAKILAENSEAIWEASLYHCQQAAEKALKGFLVYWDLPIERTHNLLLLLEKASKLDPCFDTWEDAAARLTPFSTAYRHPGALQSPDLEQVIEALRTGHRSVKGCRVYSQTKNQPSPAGSPSALRRDR